MDVWTTVVKRYINAACSLATVCVAVTFSSNISTRAFEISKILRYSSEQKKKCHLFQAPPLLDVKVRVKGLPQTWMSERERAMHVHQWGDISRNCYNTGPHYDRDNSFHGPPTATDR